MNLLMAVVDDLYSFAVGAIFGTSKRTGGEEEEREQGDDSNASAVVQELLEIDVEAEPDSKEQEAEPDEGSSFRSMDEIFNEQVGYSASGEKNTLMYIGGGETPMYLRPTREFDSVMTRLPYGAMVMVLEQNGRWTKVVHNELTGWVLRDDLMDRAAYVYPQFVVGEANGAQDPNTIRVRAMLDDAFAGGAAELDLQATEYITYRLMRKGLHLEWPETRPRTPGLWHKLLKGTRGVHVGVAPKTGSIMEYLISEDAGHVAYVEAVFPDETINISEANFPDSGIYNERILTREEWRELKPLFIQVT